MKKRTKDEEIEYYRTMWLMENSITANTPHIKSCTAGTPCGTIGEMENTKVREFTTGSTRDDNAHKLEYARFMSPLVIERYAQYMHKHRFQSDGKLRDPDNWQKLFGENHRNVCMDSLMRHVMDVWLEIKGGKSREGMEDALCGILFNAMAMLYEIEKDKQVLPESRGSQSEAD